ncbi:putative protein kinase [Plasmopara halstedii]
MRAASSPMEPLNKNILLAGEVIAEKWKIGEKIGEGTFSQIYSAYSIESRDKVAVKVEAPSSLKPVLEWESLILKSLQDCPYVCRYYYHGKHGDSTVLVMELLGDSMSMLRMSPDSIHGVPLAKAVSVGLEMLDCIEAFHKHGYVHRDIKASNFALNALSDRTAQKQQRYYIIDFGLSRQHLGEQRQVVPARQVAEFRGTSMYASLSSHRRQELGPKDDLWSWFYLVMDFLRGELPWAADAQLKNRQTVLRLKEHYTEASPSLLVEGLPGAVQLLEMMEYLQSLRYEDIPDYKRIRKQLQAVGKSSLVIENSDSGDEEASADTMEVKALADVSSLDWDALSSERERAILWVEKAEHYKDNDSVSDMLLSIAMRYKSFFDTENLSFDEQMRVQNAIYQIEKKSRARTSFFAPPPIQSFVKRRQSEQKLRSDALRKRRERDYQVRQSLEIKQEPHQAQGVPGYSPNDVMGGDGITTTNNSNQPVKSESSMEMSDTEKMGTPTVQRSNSVVDVPPIAQTYHQSPHVMTTSSGPPVQQWSHSSLTSGSFPPPPKKTIPAQFHGPSPSLPPHLTRRRLSDKVDYPPTQKHELNGKHHRVSSHTPPSPPHRREPEQRVSINTRRYDAAVDMKDKISYSNQKSRHTEDHNSAGRHFNSESWEDREYVTQRPSVSERHHDSVNEPREGRGYSTYSRHKDERLETREGRGYSTYQRAQKSPQEMPIIGSNRYYSPSIENKEDRGYSRQHSSAPQVSRRESHIEYLTKERHGQQELERYYETKRTRARSRSRSQRREVSHSRRRSYSWTSSRSRSRSYSCSPSRSPSPHVYHRSREHDSRSKRVRTKREYSHLHRSRSWSSSSSRSRSSSRSFSTSPHAKHYHRRSTDQSQLKSSHRYSSHATEYSDQSKSYVNEIPKVYTKSYSKEYVKDYPKEYVKEYPKEVAEEYAKERYVKKGMYNSTSGNVYHHHSSSSERRPLHSRDPKFARSPSERHHANYSRDDESWSVNTRHKEVLNPAKHRRSTRWQPRS